MLLTEVLDGPVVPLSDVELGAPPLDEGGTLAQTLCALGAIKARIKLHLLIAVGTSARNDGGRPRPWAGVAPRAGLVDQGWP